MNTVRMNKTRSCGCLQGEHRKDPKTHGLYYHPIHWIWSTMKARCHNPKYKDYQDYGARGVEVCSQWRNDYRAFYEWAISNGWKKGLQIDKDIKAKEIGLPALLYSPERCQFVTPKKNSNNRRNNRIIEFNGKSQTLAIWAEEIGISGPLIAARLGRLKWPIEKALTEPVTHKKRNYL